MKIVNNWFVGDERPSTDRLHTDNDAASKSKEKKTKFLKINKAKFLDIVEKNSSVHHSISNSNQKALGPFTLRADLDASNLKRKDYF